MVKACASLFSVDGAIHIFSDEDDCTETSFRGNENETEHQVKSDTETRDEEENGKDNVKNCHRMNTKSVVTEDVTLRTQENTQVEYMYTPRQMGAVVK